MRSVRHLIKQDPLFHRSRRPGDLFAGDCTYCRHRIIILKVRERFQS